MESTHMLQRRRHCRSHRILQIAMISLLLIIFFTTTTTPICVMAQAAEDTCSNNYGTSCSPSDPINNIITSDENGFITILSQTYPAPPAKHEIIIMARVVRIRSAGFMLSNLERHMGETPSQPGEDRARHEYEMRNMILKIITYLIEDALSSLALIHKEEWTNIVEDLQTDHQQHANDHFDKAANVYETMILIFKRLWYIVQLEEFERSFSLYDREAIADGQSSVYLLLADMFQQRYSIGGQDTETSDDLFVAYRYFIQSEAWGKESLSILGEHNDKIGTAESRQVDHDAIVEEVTKNLAFVQVRLGSLLIDMYTAGHVLDMDGNLRLESPLEGDVVDPSTQLGQGQKRILDLTLEKISKGSLLYAQLAAEETANEDHRLNIADSCYFMGLVYSYQFQWEDAAGELEKSMSLYDELFEEYQRAGMVSESVEFASGMIQTTQSLWEAQLSIPGKTELAKGAFRRHLVYRRYFERQVPLEQPLADEEERDDSYYKHYQSENIYDGTAMSSQFEETLKAYQMMLKEYLQLLNEYPDGSYFNMEFDHEGDNIASYVQHDKVYEGSLRSAIGSLQLAQNQVREANRSLELAVGLLREGMDEDRDSFEAYGETGEIVEYPVKLELANALLNLAYAKLGLNQLETSFDAFKEAMDIYESELADGETPMNNSGGAEKSHQTSSWGETLTRFFKERMGITDEAKSLDDSKEKGPNKDETSTEQYINLDDFQIMENITQGPGII